MWDTAESDLVEKHFKDNLDKNAPEEPKAVVVEDDGNADFEYVSDEEVVSSKK